MSAPEADDVPTEYVDNAPVASKPFRFKRRSDRGSVDNLDDMYERSRSRRHHRHHRAKHKRRKMHDHEDPDIRCGTSSLPPDVAFRESLFDALGDDEGADFWQGVYGQPIHNYSRTYTDTDTGELGVMDDEQYAQYVRRKMWERSAEGIEAAREAKRREQRQEKEARRKERSDNSSREDLAYNNFTLDFELEASLRRGEERRERRRWQQLWHEYLDRWKNLQEIYEARQGSSADNAEQIFLRNKIAWPIESGKRKDLTPDRIENFVNQVSTAVPEATKTAVLKAERIRWHPDKMQQRYGFMNIDETTMEGITAVFQVLDRIWNELRSHKS